MRRFLLRLAAALLLAAAASPAFAQAAPAGEDEKESGSVNALPYTVAALSTALVMLIVCKPSRKS